MNWSERDTQVNWHPYTQMKTAPPALAITHAEGVYLFDENGKAYIDGFSSWWVNLHGHRHPHMIAKVKEALDKMDHICFAGLTHPFAVELSEKLIQVLPENQAHIFYSDNGSTAVEVALKMALQYWSNLNQTKSTLVAIRGAYHGDTFGAMSVSDRGPFTQPFEGQLFRTEYIDFPGQSSSDEQRAVKQLRGLLQKKNVAAFIFEPLVQGVAGFRSYPQSTLNKLIAICHEFGVLAIADEVMTGFGRLGPLFASEILDEKPDLICLSKGLTGGMFPLGATTCSQPIFEAFLSTDPTKTLFHGHSYTANPIACAAGIASLELVQSQECREKRGWIEQCHRDFAEKIALSPNIKSVRVNGTILAIEIRSTKETSYLNNVGRTLIPLFLENGVFLRPLGNIIYTIPPYCIQEDDLQKIYRVIELGLDRLGVEP